MADEIDYKIHGDSIQFVEITLDQNETVIAEAGAMFYCDPGIAYEAKMGDGSTQGFGAKLFQAASRAISGESVFLTHFTNTDNTRRNVAFSAPTPGQIIPINLAEHNGSIICQRDAFLAAAHGTKISVTLNRRLGAGFFGGEGFILQKLESDGMALIHAGGTIIHRRLVGETLRVDTGCVVAFDESVDFSIEASGGLKTMLFSGEGIFVATLSGTGDVWLQSMPFSRLAERIQAHLPHSE